VSERWRTRDVRIQLLAIAAGIIASAAIGAVVGEWSGAWAIGGFLGGNAAVKVFQPSNTILKDISWAHFLVVAVLVLAVLYLVENPRWLGGWTIIVVFGVFFVYGLVSLIVSTRGSASDDGANDERAD